jgi:hypothetical protein
MATRTSGRSKRHSATATSATEETQDESSLVTPPPPKKPKKTALEIEIQKQQVNAATNVYEKEVERLSGNNVSKQFNNTLLQRFPGVSLDSIRSLHRRRVTKRMNDATRTASAAAAAAAATASPPASDTSQAVAEQSTQTSTTTGDTTTGDTTTGDTTTGGTMTGGTTTGGTTTGGTTTGGTTTGGTTTGGTTTLGTTAGMQANNHSPSVSAPLSATAISTLPSTPPIAITNLHHGRLCKKKRAKACKSVQKHAKERFGFAKNQKSDLFLTPFLMMFLDSSWRR